MDRLHFTKALLAVAFMVFGVHSFAKEKVNIITWWGYLTKENVKNVEAACNVSIYFDEYYSNPEFLRRVKKGSYDVAIYSHTVHKTLLTKVETSKVNIGSDISANYKPKFKHYYEHAGYPTDTVIFQIALTGFIWNPANITLNQKDTITSTFAKAKGKTLMILDEPVEVLNLLSRMESLDGKRHMPTINDTVHLFKDANVIVSNNIGRIHEMEDFTFALNWSGEAYRIMATQNDKLKFFMHPKLSHWSHDLLSLVSSRSGAECVAKRMAGKSFISDVSKDSYYFSPYSDVELNAVFDEAQAQFYKEFENLQPLKGFNNEEYQKLDQEWQQIKMHISL